MNQAVKAAIFSALLFPGWGQIYLKNYKRGIAIILPTLFCIISLCFVIIRVAINVIKASPLKKGTIDMQSVLKIAADSVQVLNSRYIVFILLPIFILWIISIVDAYLLGKKQIQMITSEACGDTESE
jgi:TM2 domain-containing membrane protein YozV